ncbi:MAG TPA: hypothetical protein VGE07_12660 [Herpetosiphonaceae bacterium]
MAPAKFRTTAPLLLGLALAGCASSLAGAPPDPTVTPLATETPSPTAAAPRPTSTPWATPPSPPALPTEPRPPATPTRPPAGAVTAFAFADAEHGWVVRDAALWATIDGGASWSQRHVFPEPITRLDLVSREIGWAAAGERAYQTLDGGATWQPFAVPGWAARLDFADPLHGWTPLQRTSDGGGTWTAARPCGDMAGRAVSFVSASEGWMLCAGEPSAVNQQRRLIHTTDGGGTWAAMHDGATESPSIWTHGYSGDLFFLDGRRGWLWLGRADLGRLHETEDGGATWRELDSTSADLPTEFQFVSPTIGFGLSNPSRRDRHVTVLLATEDGGGSWRQIFPQP